LNNKKILYPAIFHKEDNGAYSVVFPDLGCATCGTSIEEAYFAAKEALVLWLEDCESKAPSKIENIVAKFGDYIMLIEPDS